MNKILFIHGEEKIKEDKAGNFYTDGCYNNKVWERYMSISPNITAIFRKENEIYDYSYATSKFQKLDSGIKFVKIENRKKNIWSYLSLRLKKHNNKIIENEVKNSDLIIARIPSDDSYVAIKYAKKYNKKVLAEVVGCPFDTLWNHSTKGKLLAIPGYFKLKKYVKMCDYVQYVTEKFLQKRYPTNENSIACSDVNIGKLQKNVLFDRLDKIEKFSKNKKIVIGTIGTLDVKYKGHYDVFKLIKFMKNKGYNIEYRMVGAGSSGILKRMAKKEGIYTNCKFIGSIPHEQIYSYIDQLDIYIQPSYTEGLCRALIESISRACPTIASNAGGNPELVDSGYIYKKKNIRDLIGKFEQLIDSKENLKAQALKNFTTAEKYTEETLNIKREQLYAMLRTDINKKTRILHLYEKMDKGGAETFIMNVFREINKEKFEFNFLCTSEQYGFYDEEIRLLGGKIGRIQSPMNLHPYRSYKNLLNYLKQNGPYDAIHIPTMFYSGIVCLAARRARIPKIIVHSHSAKDKNSKNPLRLLYRLVMRTLINTLATDRLACGIAAAKTLYGTVNDIKIIQNGIKLDDYYKVTDKEIETLKKELNIKDEFIIGNVARFVPLKNQLFFLKLAEKLKRHDLKFKIVLVGEGQEKDKVIAEVNKKNLQKYFIFTGLRNDIPVFMNMFNVMIMPSLYEGFPLTVVEALAAGTPCVLSSNISRETNIIDDMVSFLDLNDDLQKWANIISGTKKHKKEYTNKILIEKGFDINSTTKKLEEIYIRR